MTSKLIHAIRRLVPPIWNFCTFCEPFLMFRLHLDLSDLLNTRYLHGTQSISGDDFIDGQGQVDYRNNELRFRMHYRLKSIKTSPDLTAIGIEISGLVF